MTLWEVEIRPAEGQFDFEAHRVLSESADLQLGIPSAYARRGYLVQCDEPVDIVRSIAGQVLADPIVECLEVGPLGDARCFAAPAEHPQLVYVLLKPGVMDPVALTAQTTLRELGLNVNAVRTFRKYWFPPLPDDQRQVLAAKILANESIEQVVWGSLALEHLELGSPYQFRRIEVPLEEMDDEQLREFSRQKQLYLTVEEMRAVRDYFRGLGRAPTDIELETFAQTWSEHCSHKTLMGPVDYTEGQNTYRFQNLLRETIFRATEVLLQQESCRHWCVSVFRDNAGVVRFDEQWNLVFKVETHNHPSAIEPYGGANTGIGGVIRDPLGTGLGAKPIANTDVFCFAPPDTPYESLPPGVLHPRRIMKGVVAGVRDYGNRMGIPTVNGAIVFDSRYLANPLVYCGTVGLLPHRYSFKSVQPGDLIVVIGGRTGRDGIHGATFSSAELSSDSESVSGGAVQIGNPITEKMLLDVLLQARDQELYRAITDCGAGGFSSAIGEMARHLGAEVWLEKAPLKYEGLSYCEIWISESQERMILAVPPEKWPKLEQLCRAEDVEAAVIGQFNSSGKLRLLYDGHTVGELDLEFLHEGRPRPVRPARYQPSTDASFTLPPASLTDHTATLHRILSQFSVASKEWVIRQYDHEVQGASVIKPLVGVEEDGPSDAAVLRPVLDSYQGVAIACGINPRYGDFDTYAMAASAIDEAVRNCVAVGADPNRIALLDNFCWGNTERPETLGSLVRAALACRDVAIEFQTPFISGKDSLNNEFTFERGGQSESISIPGTLLISAIGIVPDVRRCVTIDVKQPGNHIFLVGHTGWEWAGTHFCLVHGLRGGRPPTVEPRRARRIFLAVFRAIRDGLVRACHDLSEGGLAVAAAEMAFAGGWGVELTLPDPACAVAPIAVADPVDDPDQWDAMWLFAESNSRFLCEVPPGSRDAFLATVQGVPVVELGKVQSHDRLVIRNQAGKVLIDAPLGDLKHSWQSPLRW
ncbi:MAG: phosphoribosylformylglycinamidine synthase subunit PurL [Pirellulaceae bacterium]|nr:MAG: phosphoribosylformylglycinamidine synthase subunit PurL [Pirellulaceae bacterium]